MTHRFFCFSGMDNPYQTEKLLKNRFPAVPYFF